MRALVFRLAMLAALITAPAHAEAQPNTRDAINATVTVEHIRPAYARLAKTTAALERQVDRFCAAPDAAGLAVVRDFFAPAFLAWQGAQHMRFGPVQLFMRDFRFQLWPDKRGSVGRHLDRLIAEDDPAALEGQRFTAGSVAVQGFSAFERLAFSPAMGKFDAPTFAARCRVLRAIAANLAAMSAAVDSEWAQAKPADDVDARQTELLVALHTELESIVSQKLALPLGSDAAHARGKRAEAWRSGLSRAALRENLLAAQALYRLAFAPQIDDAALAADVAAGFDAAFARLDAIDRPLAEAVAEPRERGKIEALRAALSQLKADIAGRLAPALGLTLGFNSLDGD